MKNDYDTIDQFNKMEVKSSSQVDNVGQRYSADEARKFKSISCILGIACAVMVVIIAGISHGGSSGAGESSSTSGHLRPSNTKETEDLVVSCVQSTMKAMANPCEDFYQYACGSWVDNTELPADRGYFSRSFTTIAEENLLILNQTLSNNWPLIGEFYRSCMNTDRLDIMGMSPLVETLEMIEQNSSTKENLIMLAGQLSIKGVELFTGSFIDSDKKDATLNRLSIQQAGLSLPDRSYYLEDSKKKKYIDPLKVFMKYVLERKNELAAKTDNTLNTVKDIPGIIDRMISLETSLAQRMTPLVELRDPVKTYNPMTANETDAFAPNLIRAYLTAADVPLKNETTGQELTFVVVTPEYFKKAEELIMNNISVETLKEYLSFQVILGASTSLDSGFRDASFDFFGKALQGRSQQPERWKTCVSSTSSFLGELAARYYVINAFKGDSMTTAQNMVNYIEETLHDHILSLEWMDEETKKAAVEKLAMVTNLIGHPTKYETYDVVLKDDTFFKNKMILTKRSHYKAVNTIGKIADRNKWEMLASEVNAYYSPPKNQIVFPAGILQPPFFSANYSLSMIYGAIGMVIGHEITHGFDDQGSQYDGNGNLRPWWSNSTREEFNKRSKCLADQYSTFEVFDSNNKLLGNVNGPLTLGENIADNGGLKLAYKAYLKHRTSALDEEKVAVPGISQDQLFFVAYAQSWCSKSSDATAESRLTTDVHSPDRWRVNGPLSNNEFFSEVFKCPIGSPMNPKDKCILW